MTAENRRRGGTAATSAVSQAGGRLTLVATPIGNLGDLSPRAAAALAEADVIACEDTRHTRKLLSHLGVPAGGRLVAVHDHNEAASVGAVLRLLDEGRHVVLVSDAGTPAISDPGHRLVAAATAAGATVDAVPGPNAAITALVVSGLPTDRFCFEGFLPRRGRERAARLAGIAAEGRTTVLYEAPTRVRSTVADLAEVCGGLRQVAIARELTKLYEEVWRGSLAAATEHLDSDGQEPRGEHVIVVAGAPPAGEASQAAVEQLVGDRLAAGQSTRDVAGAVATELGVPRRQAYETALRLERESAEQGGKRESPAGGTRVGR